MPAPTVSSALVALAVFVAGAPLVAEDTPPSDRIPGSSAARGSFQRSFTLPRTVKADSITADFEKGVLHVRMP